MKWTLIILFVAAASGAGQQPTPAPAVQHDRIAQTEVAGRRFELRSLVGATLLISPKFYKGSRVPLIIHFHGAPWLIEYQIAKHMPRAALITVQLGAGSAVYNRPFDGTDTFRAMTEEARRLLGLKYDWSSIKLTAWSACYGAVRAILRDEANFARVSSVLLLDGIHASYSPEGKPLSEGGVINGPDLDSFLKFARLAAAGKKTFVITHSEIVPGTYASTTECTNYLLYALGLKRISNPRAGPMSMKQLSSADSRGLHVRGYSGNTAADHIDHVHSMSAWLKLLK
jgi:hypothetical protein